MNADRLMTLARFLRTAVPAKLFYLPQWFSSEDGPVQVDEETLEPDCGAAACAFGWATRIPEFRAAGLFAVGTLPAVRVGTTTTGFKLLTAFDAANEFFGLLSSQSYWLFMPDDYPDRDATPAQVADRIEWFVGRGGVCPARMLKTHDGYRTGFRIDEKFGDEWYALAFRPDTRRAAVRIALNIMEAEPARVLRLVQHKRYCADRVIPLEQPTARFWDWVNSGWVKITLKPDETLTWDHYRPDEEGWTALSMSWYYAADENQIEHETTVRSRDCDGRSDFVCPVGELAALPAEPAVSRDIPGRPARPDWRCVKSGQRDHAAEAANY